MVTIPESKRSQGPTAAQRRAYEAALAHPGLSWERIAPTMGLHPKALQGYIKRYCRATGDPYPTRARADTPPDVIAMQAKAYRLAARCRARSWSELARRMGCDHQTLICRVRSHCRRTGAAFPDRVAAPPRPRPRDGAKPTPAEATAYRMARADRHATFGDLGARVGCSGAEFTRRVRDYCRATGATRPSRLRVVAEDAPASPPPDLAALMARRLAEKAEADRELVSRPWSSRRPGFSGFHAVPTAGQVKGRPETPAEVCRAMLGDWRARRRKAVAS